MIVPAPPPGPVQWGPSLVQRCFRACWMHQQLQNYQFEMMRQYAIPSAEERLREALRLAFGPPSGVLYDHLERNSPAR